MKRGIPFSFPASVIALVLSCLSCNADEAGLRQLKNALDDFSSEHGHQASDQDFLRLAFELGSDIADEEFWLAWKHLGQLQSPAISKQDLSDLYEVKRSSIRSVNLEYEVVRTGTTELAASTPEETSRYVVKGSKQFRQNLRGDDPSAQETVGYDGKVVRRLRRDPTGRNNGSVDLLQSRVIFIRPDTNVLANARLLDSVLIFGEPNAATDLVELLKSEDVIVLEQPERVGDVDCLVVSQLSERVLLDANRDYAIVRSEFLTGFDEKPGLDARVDLGEYEEFDNGLWIPREMTVERFEFQTGKLTETTRVKVTRLETNEDEKIDDTVFTGVFPRGTIVADGVDKLTYIAGVDGSIEQVLNMVTPVRPFKLQKRPNRTWLIAINAVIIAVIIAAVVVYWMRRDKHDEAAP